MKGVIKFFLIFSCVLLSCTIVGAIWAIPMTVILVNKLEYDEEISTGWKVCTILFLSPIAGLLICDDEYYDGMTLALSGYDINPMKNLTKVSLIISCIIVSCTIVGAFWAIPMTVSLVNKLEYDEEISNGWKVCTILFLSPTAGIRLCVDEYKMDWIKALTGSEKKPIKSVSSTANSYSKENIKTKSMQNNENIKAQLLLKYKKLYDEGILTEDEYIKLKSKIL